MNNPQKDFLDILYKIIAIYGAGLSTILAARDFTKERRRLQITLEKIHWVEGHRILLTNIGHRPITITDINLTFDSHGGTAPIRGGAYWSETEGYEPPKMPLNITDGQTVVFYLSEYLSNELNQSNGRLMISVFDAEGHVFKRYKEGIYDPKYNYRGPKYKRNRLREFTWTLKDIIKRKN